MIHNDITTDPNPELPDHPLWDKVLSSAKAVVGVSNGETVNRLLWTIRSVGAKIESVDGKRKIVPLIHPEGKWEDMQEWNDIAIPSLKKYAAEIKKCLEVLG